MLQFIFHYFLVVQVFMDRIVILNQIFSNSSCVFISDQSKEGHYSHDRCKANEYIRKSIIFICIGQGQNITLTSETPVIYYGTRWCTHESATKRCWFNAIGNIIISTIIVTGRADFFLSCTDILKIILIRITTSNVFTKIISFNVNVEKKEEEER